MYKLKNSDETINAHFHDGKNISETLAWLKDQGVSAIHAGRGNIAFSLFGRMQTFTGQFWLVNAFYRVLPFQDGVFQEFFQKAQDEDPDQTPLFDSLNG